MEQKTKQVMAKIFDTSMKSIREGASMDTVENRDSLRHMHLVMALEEEFKV